MPRVLRIVNRLSIGGPTLNVAYLSKYLPSDYETLLVSGASEKEEKSSAHIVRDLGIEPVFVHKMKRAISPTNDTGAYYQIREIIRKFKPDIVHTHAAKAGALGRLAAAHENVPVIVHTFHGHVFHSYFSALASQFFLQAERYFAKKSTKIIAISQQQLIELCDQYQVAPREKFEVVPLGFDLTRFQHDYEPKRVKFRTEFNLDHDTIAIGIIGRLVGVKNHELFLKGISHLMANTNQKFRAFIVGDGELRQLLEIQASQLNIPFNVETDTFFDKPLVFTSWRSDIDTINAGCDLICLTSHNEGTPVSLIEAQASNNPILSTRVGGISDIVREGETAILCEPNDVEDFSAKLLELVNNHKRRNTMGHQGYDFVIKNYHYKRLCNDMDELYQRLLTSKLQAY